MSSFSQSRCFCDFLDLGRKFIHSFWIVQLQFSKLILILVSHYVHFTVDTIRFSRNNSHEEENNYFSEDSQIENCFDRFRTQFSIFFSSFLEQFEGQSEIWNFYFEFWRKLNIYIIFDVCFIIRRLSWIQRK